MFYKKLYELELVRIKKQNKDTVDQGSPNYSPQVKSDREAIRTDS